METKYVINESTLIEIADAIRYQENSAEMIPMEDFATHVKNIEPVVEEYMKITDYSDDMTAVNEDDYTQVNIERCSELYAFYSEMEVPDNGK